MGLMAEGAVRLLLSPWVSLLLAQATNHLMSAHRLSRDFDRFANDRAEALLKRTRPMRTKRHKSASQARNLIL